MMAPGYVPLPALVVAVRLAWEQDAAHAKLPRPAMASYWRWVAIERGERAVRDVEARGLEGEV